MDTFEKKSPVLTQPISENPEEVKKELTFIDLDTHVRFDLSHVLILKTKKLLKSEVESNIGRGIEFAVSHGDYSPSSTFFFLNYTTVYDKKSRKTNPKGLCFVYFEDSAFPQIFLGKNSNGSERVEFFPDPSFVEESWEEVEKEEKVYNGWDDLDFSNFMEPGANWADIVEKEYEEEEKKKAPMLERKLNPISVLYGRGVSEEKFKIECEGGFAKIRKEDFVGHDHSRVFAQIPAWVNLFELRDVFSLFSKSESYPILEYSVDPVKKMGTFFASFAPGSDGAILSKLMLFNHQYTRVGKTVSFMPFLSKEGMYSRCLNRGRDYNLVISSRSNPKKICGVPSDYFGKKLNSDKNVFQKSGAQSDKWRPNQSKDCQKTTQSTNRSFPVQTPPKRYNPSPSPVQTPPKRYKPPSPSSSSQYPRKRYKTSPPSALSLSPSKRRKNPVQTRKNQHQKTYEKEKEEDLMVLSNWIKK
jgi:hypothetical protein